MCVSHTRFGFWKIMRVRDSLVFPSLLGISLTASAHDGLGGAGLVLLPLIAAIYLGGIWLILKIVLIFAAPNLRPNFALVIKTALGGPLAIFLFRPIYNFLHIPFSAWAYVGLSLFSMVIWYLVRRYISVKK
jgi:hypothetical protein